MQLLRALVLVNLFASLAVSVPCASGADGTDDVLTIKKASVGFGGKFKAGFWQPVRVTVVAGAAGARGRLQLVVPDGDQVPVVYQDSSRGELELSPAQEKTVLLYAKSGPIDSAIEVRLLNAAGGVSWSQRLVGVNALRSTQELIVGLGPSMGLDEAVATIRRRGETVSTVQVSANEELPDRWWGYDGVDVVALATSDLKFIQALTNEQRQAIALWVKLGGRLLLSVGARGAEIGEPGSGLSSLIPGEFVEVTPLRERSGLENFTKVELPFDDPGFQRNRPYVTRLKNTRGEIVLDEASASAGRPLVVHAPMGLGQVTFVAIDLDHESLKNWKGRPRLVAALIQRGGAEHEQGDREAPRGVTHLGYDDLIGQLRAALDQFPGVSLVNFTTVSGLTLAYLLLIGPADYLLLSRLSLPRHLTWLTFPIVAASVIAIAAGIGNQVHGRRVRLNQAEIIDIDLAQQIARGTVWCHLYSPRTRRFDARLQVAAPAGVVDGPVQGGLTWQGLPGAALGGLESRQPALVSREAYEVTVPGEQPGIDGLTVQVASSKSLSGCWWARTDLPTETKLTVDRYGQLAGEFTVPKKLNTTLTDCILAHGEKLYRARTLAAGQRISMANMPPLNLEARLTQRRVEQSKDVSTPWERDSVDIPRIMQMLMFHESARGKSYTGLTHQYQPKMDLSEHVRLGQAVLVGRAERPVAQICRGNSGAPLVTQDDANTWTWFRIVLPVERSNTQ